MRSRINIVLMFQLLTSVATAMSYGGSWPAPGHRQSSSLVLEGVRGLDEIYKGISSGIDDDFYTLFKDKFGSYPSGNHRILGHWGFSGAIPFNDEPYKSALAKYPKKEVSELWRNYVSSIIEKVAKTTGLERKQAQALAGLIYNTHILSDYTGSKLVQLANPELLLKDIGNNLHALFGNNSDFARQILEELAQVSKSEITSVEKAQRMCAILVKHNIGEKLVKVYGKQLSQMGITYLMDPAKRALYDKAAQAINAQFFQSALAQAITTGDGKTLTQKQVASYMTRVTGVLQEANVKGRKAFILSIPLQFSAEERIASKIAKELLQEAAQNGHTIDVEFIKRQIAVRLQDEIAKTLGKNISKESAESIAQQSLNWAKLNPTNIGCQTGVMTFIFIEGVTVYKFASGDIDHDAFIKETSNNLGASFLTGAATYCAVVLGATPTGWVVVGIGIGVNVAWNLAFNRLSKEFLTPEITLDDVLGTLPTELQRRRHVWNYEGHECLFNYQETPDTLFAPNTSKDSLFGPDLSNPSLFDYTNERKTLFE